MAHINVAVDGGFHKKDPQRVQFALAIKQVKNGIADFAYAPPNRQDVHSGSVEYEQALDNERIAAEVAELNAVTTALAALDDLKNGYYQYPVEETTFYVDSADALQDIDNCRRGIIEPIDGSFADACRMELLQKIGKQLAPNLVRLHVNFQKVDAHRTPAHWHTPNGKSVQEYNDVMLMHTACDGLVKAERKKKS